MSSFQQYLAEYRKQLKNGDIKTAYKGLMEYFDALKLHLKNAHPDYFVSGTVSLWAYWIIPTFTSS